jgi:hypothetical protein
VVAVYLESAMLDFIFLTIGVGILAAFLGYAVLLRRV